MSGVKRTEGRYWNGGHVTVNIQIGESMWTGTENVGSDPELVVRVLNDLLRHVSQAALASVTIETVDGPQSAATGYTASPMPVTDGPCAVCGCVAGCHLGAGVIEPQGHAYRPMTGPGYREVWDSYTPHTDAVTRAAANLGPMDPCLVCNVSKGNHHLVDDHLWADPQPKPMALRVMEDALETLRECGVIEPKGDNDK
jgi:hypothetical protein